MLLNRRQFLLLGAGLVAGCRSTKPDVLSPARGTRDINAGPVADYAADGVYSRFRDQGFFIIRQGGRLFVLSAFCTHRHCKLTAEPDHSFFCQCHGSTFAPGGKVTKGPAKRDLSAFSTFINESGELLVKVPAV
jgi:Rieske Fe-S protein